MHQLSQIVNDEDFGSGSTGKKTEQLLSEAGDFLEKNRDNIKAAVGNGNKMATTLVDRRRELAEFLDFAPMHRRQPYNIVDRRKRCGTCTLAHRSNDVR